MRLAKLHPRRGRTFLGRRLEISPSSGFGFYVTPRWTRRRKRELAGPDGERIEVHDQHAADVEEVLSNWQSYVGLPRSNPRRVISFGDEGAEWPGLVIRENAVEARVVARVSTTAGAERLASLLDRLEFRRAREPRSVGWWLRGF